ncbi:MAG: ABC transporter substrate-binding protein [Thermodesulfobacteriota bacterium]
MKKYFWLLIMLLGVLILWHADHALAQKILKFGHLNAFSGGVSLYGADSKRAITMALEEINAKGGVNVGGQRYLLEVEHMDGKYQPADTVAAYRRLVDLHGIRFIHNMGTVTGKALMAYNEKDGVLLDIISPSETLNLEGNKLVLNQVVRPNGYDPPVVREAIRRGLKNLCVIADDSDFGKEHTEVITRTFTQLGGKVLAVEYVKTAVNADFMPVLTKLKGYRPDCMYIVALEEPGIRITKQAREAGITAKLLYCEHFKQKTIDSVGIENLEGTLFVGSYSTLSSMPVPGSPEDILNYRNKYMKRWPGEYLSATGCYGYNWVYYTAKAMELAGTVTDVHKIRGMASQAIKNSALKYEGFTKGGRAYGMPTFVLAIDNGKVHVASGTPYPKELAELGEK